MLQNNPPLPIHEISPTFAALVRPNYGNLSANRSKLPRDKSDFDLARRSPV
jgi:hypothetical protein